MHTVPAGTYIWPVFGSLDGVASQFRVKFAAKKIRSTKDFIFSDEDIIPVPAIPSLSRFVNSTFGKFIIVKFAKYAKMNDREDAIGFIVKVDRCYSNSDIADIDTLISPHSPPIASSAGIVPPGPRPMAVNPTIAPSPVEQEKLRLHADALFKFLNKALPSLQMDSMRVEFRDQLGKEIFSYRTYK